MGLGHLMLMPEQYGALSLKDLDTMYKGWLEIRQSERYDSWERTRWAALYSITHPAFKAPNNFDTAFRNPYAPKPKGGKKYTNEEVIKRLENWDKLNYKEHPMYGR